MTSDTSLELQPLKHLQDNSSNFFAEFQKKHGQNMQCRSGCSSCCYVDLSIFEGEAQIIIDWAANLPENQKTNVLNALQSQEGVWKKNTLGKKNKPCPFLINNTCSVYEVRPIICRTQGMPLQYKISDVKNQVQLAVDVCPLNFSTENTLPDRAQWLDLDRLNSLQSIAENHFQKNRTHRASFDEIKNAENRVPLQKLKKFLIELLAS